MMSEIQSDALDTIKKRIVDDKWLPYTSIYQTVLPGHNRVRTLGIFYMYDKQFVLLKFDEIDGSLELDDIKVIVIGNKHVCLASLADEIRLGIGVDSD